MILYAFSGCFFQLSFLGSSFSGQYKNIPHSGNTGNNKPLLSWKHPCYLLPLSPCCWSGSGSLASLWSFLKKSSWSITKRSADHSMIWKPLLRLESHEKRSINIRRNCFLRWQDKRINVECFAAIRYNNNGNLTY